MGWRKKTCFCQGGREANCRSSSLLPFLQVQSPSLILTSPGKKTNCGSLPPSHFWWISQIYFNAPSSNSLLCSSLQIQQGTPCKGTGNTGQGKRLTSGLYLLLSSSKSKPLVLLPVSHKNTAARLSSPFPHLLWIPLDLPFLNSPLPTLSLVQPPNSRRHCLGSHRPHTGPENR